MKQLKSNTPITHLSLCSINFHKGANLLRMPKQNIITNNDVMALFSGLTKLIGEYNPKYAKMFSNYQTLYQAFVEAQGEIKKLRAQIETIKKSTLD